MEEGSADRNHNLEGGSGSEGLFMAGEVARAENQKRERGTPAKAPTATIIITCKKIKSFLDKILIADKIQNLAFS